MPWRGQKLLFRPNVCFLTDSFVSRRAFYPLCGPFSLLFCFSPNTSALFLSLGTARVNKKRPRVCRHMTLRAHPTRCVPVSHVNIMRLRPSDLLLPIFTFNFFLAIHYFQRPFFILLPTFYTHVRKLTKTYKMFIANHFHLLNKLI